MTPRDVNIMIGAAAWRNEQRVKMDARLAWLTASLSRSKRLPPLNRLLRRRKKITASEDAEYRSEYNKHKVDNGKILKILKEIKANGRRRKTIRRGPNPDSGDAR